jgi:Neurotransmitter-gated ion-channel ligand binding domain
MEAQAFGFRLRANLEGQKPLPIRVRLSPRCALGRSVVLLFCIATLLWFPHAMAADEKWLPPGEMPVEVAAGFFLANLSGAAERSETFEADLYLSFRWHDPRLAFAGTEPKRFLEDAALEQLKEMWWPQLEFVNTGQPEVANRALDISPDGSVRYKLAVTATFRSDLDLRRFPFDRETLEVRIQSFIWMRDQMVFVSDPERIGFNPRSTFEELAVRRVSTEIRQRELTGWTAAESYSEFVALIEVQRRAAFYMWTVFTPVTLIFLISCVIFVLPIKEFNGRIGISLTALLACIAMQFTVSFNLPQVSYLTVIGWMFVVTYFCLSLGVLISTVQATLLANQPERAMRLDRLAGLGLPALFFALIALCMI